MKKFTIAIFLILVLSGSASATDHPSPPGRIISLAPSTTEILFALGLGDNIVGVTSFCDFPEAAKKKPKIGGMSNPSLEAIITLKPDLVVMTTDGNPREVDERLRSLKIHTYVFTARMLHELPGGIRELGSAIGMREKADALAREMETGMMKAASRARSQGPATMKKKALFIVWPEPLLVAGPGSAIHDALTLLGAENTASRADMAYPRYSIEEVIRESPDVLFIGKGSGMDMRVVSQGILKKLSAVPAVKNGAVCYPGDGLYRLGPRVIMGMEELAECLK
jgi:iron complex transport system substrate-binding protein